jgi:hypothetical protein
MRVAVMNPSRVPPNTRLQRTRPLLRILLNVKGSGLGPCR